MAAALYDKNGKLYAYYPTNLPLSEFPTAPEAASLRFQSKQLTTFKTVSLEGDQAGTLYLKADLNEMYRHLSIYALILFGVLVGAGAVAIYLSNVFQSWISQPLLELAQTAKVVSKQKDYSVRAVKNSNDEIGVLTEAFNAMLNQIQTSDTALRRSEARLSAVFNQASAGIAQTDLSGRFLMVNDRYCEITGRSRDELSKLRVHDITYAEDLVPSLNLFGKLVKDATAFVVEKRYVRPNGEPIWVRDDVGPCATTTGRWNSSLPSPRILPIANAANWNWNGPG